MSHFDGVRSSRRLNATQHAKQSLAVGTLRVPSPPIASLAR